MSDQAASVISRLLGRGVDTAEPPGQPNPLDTWPERAGTTVDIGALRRRHPHIRWHTFTGWAATQDWQRLLVDCRCLFLP